MAKLAPVQWLYIVLMVSAIAVSIWGIVVTVALARGKTNAYRDALIMLIASMISAGVQTFVSIALRGKGAPQNMRFYLTMLVVTSSCCCGCRLSGGSSAGSLRAARADLGTPTGLAAFVGGLVVLTTPLWASPTHIGSDGAQWVSVIRTPLLLGGALLMLAGIGLLAWAGRTAIPIQPASRFRSGKTPSEARSTLSLERKQYEGIDPRAGIAAP